jgi:hypothetical protein
MLGRLPTLLLVPGFSESFAHKTPAIWKLANLNWLLNLNFMFSRGTAEMLPIGTLIVQPFCKYIRDYWQP